MRVGLNLIFLVPGATGGVETYARELIAAMLAAAPEVSFTAFVNRETASAEGPWQEMPRVLVPVRASNRLEWVRGEQTLLPRLAQRERTQLVHSLANTAPAWGRFIRVTTVHDLAFRLAPEAHLGLLGRGMGVLVPLAIRRSQRIIVDAGSTREDIQRHYGVAAGRIDVVPLGVGAPRRARIIPEHALREKLQAASRPIALCVAAKRPHKNLPRLIRALALIPPATRPLLVIPGYPTAHEREVRGEVARLGLQDDVRLLDWIAEEELEGLYEISSCFVFPSLYEGFGLPVLEAMARGLPVACSHRGSLAEVAGDAALVFDPESEAEIAAAIQRLLGDGELRRRLREAGESQVRRFSWSATAAGTLASYRAVSLPPGSPASKTDPSTSDE